MTKVTILGEEPQKKELKKIEFVKSILEDGEWMTEKDNCLPASNWDNVVLLLKDWRGSRYDLMLAYDTRQNGVLILGHFNDGVV